MHTVGGVGDRLRVVNPTSESFLQFLQTMHTYVKKEIGCWIQSNQLRSKSLEELQSLSQLKTVVLVKIQVEDLSMLSHVITLKLIKCKAQQYPTPVPLDDITFFQSWYFRCCDITTLQGYEHIKQLEIDECQQIRDLSMLGKVRYLRFNGCRGVNETIALPTPQGRLQEWSFAECTLMPSQVQALDGLHFLGMTDCKLAESPGDLTLAPKVHTLIWKSCSRCNLQPILLKIHKDMDTLVIGGTNVRVDDIGNARVVTLTKFERLPLSSFNPLEIRTQQLYLCSLEILPSFLTLFTPMLQKLHVLSFRSCVGKCELTQELRDILLSIDTLTIRGSSTMVLEGLGDVILHEPLHRDKFDDLTIRFAVNLWCAFPAKAQQLYGPIAQWDVSQVTDMHQLFFSKSHFNDDISTWNISNVKSMQDMFSLATYNV